MMVPAVMVVPAAVKLFDNSRYTVNNQIVDSWVPVGPFARKSWRSDIGIAACCRALRYNVVGKNKMRVQPGLIELLAPH